MSDFIISQEQRDLTIQEINNLKKDKVVLQQSLQEQQT